MSSFERHAARTRVSALSKFFLRSASPVGADLRDAQRQSARGARRGVGRVHGLRWTWRGSSRATCEPRCSTTGRLGQTLSHHSV